MVTKTLALSAALVLSLGGAALAQTPAGGGSAEGNLNNPGSVKSNSEKMDERTTGSATGGTTGTVGGTNAGAVPGASGGPSTATTGAPAGSTGGNASTGSGAAPSGR